MNLHLFEITNAAGLKVVLNLFYMNSFRQMTLEVDGTELAGFVRLVMSNGEVYHLDGTSSEQFLKAMKDFSIRCAT